MARLAFRPSIISPMRCRSFAPSRASVAALLAALALLSGCACGGGSPSISSHGVRLDLPRGWSGRTESVGGRLAYLQVANFPLRHRAPPKQLGKAAIVVTLSEAGSAGAVLRRPVRHLQGSEPVVLRPGDLLSRRSPRRPVGRAGAILSFEVKRRYFTVEADLAPQRASRTLRRVNSLLRTLAIERR